MKKTKTHTDNTFLKTHIIEIIELLLILIFLMINIIIIDTYFSENTTLNTNITPITNVNTQEYQQIKSIIQKKYIYNAQSYVPQIVTNNVF